MHHYENPKSNCTDLEILLKIPKKLEKPLVNLGRGTVVGYGIDMVSGIDLFKFGLAGLVGLITCIGTGVIWTTTQKNDLQGGMAIAQVMMLVVTYVVTLRGMAENSL